MLGQLILRFKKRLQFLIRFRNRLQLLSLTNLRLLSNLEGDSNADLVEIQELSDRIERELRVITGWDGSS